MNNLTYAQVNELLELLEIVENENMSVAVLKEALEDRAEYLCCNEEI